MNALESVAGLDQTAPAAPPAPLLAEGALEMSALNVIDFPKPKKRRAAVKARARRIIAVGGGKGGVGKSLVSANLSIALAQRGARVVVVDADLGGANLHTCLGVPQPAVSLSDFVEHRKETIEEVLVDTGVERLQMISGAYDMLNAANTQQGKRMRLIRHLRSLDADYVILDLGAGTSLNVVDFFLAADRGVVVMLPEPTSIENAYRFVKTAFFRKLQMLERTVGIKELVATAMAGGEGSPQTPWEVLAKVRETNVAAASRLEMELSTFQPWLVVNQARSRNDYDVGLAVTSAWKKFFGLQMGYLGAVNHDDAVWRALRVRRPLLLESPDCGASTALLRVAENLLALGG